MSSNQFLTFSDANKKFGEFYPKKLQVISIVNRFVLTELGLNLQGSRMTKEEKEMASKVAKNLYLQNFDRQKIENILSKSFERQNTSKKIQKSAKSHLKFYLDFLEKISYLKNPESESENIFSKDTTPYRLKHNPTRYVDKTYLQQSKVREAKEPITLRFECDFYLQDYLKKDLEQNLEGIQKNIDNKLEVIDNKLKDFEEFYRLELNAEQSTIKGYLENLKRLLGWLYKQDKDLNSVDFEAIVAVVDVNVNSYGFNSFQEYTIAKIKAEEEAKEKAKTTRNFIGNFFAKYYVKDVSTREKYIQAVIALAKYLYKDITDEDEVENYEDIPVIRNLRHYRRKLKRINQSPPKTKVLKFTWNEILLIREQLKKEADLQFSFSNRQKRGVVEKKKRGKKAIAKSKMRFLVFCLFTIIPPDRARTIRELRIGETLKLGKKTKEGFIPCEQLSNPSKAKYYIHLQHKDYKTGKIYGEFWGEIPNHVFSDGSKFYDYLNDWIYGGWREILLKDETHNYCFFRSETSVPHTVDSLHHFVAKTFRSKTGIKMGTHALRDIFCTYLDEIDAPDEVRASAAYWMKHSELIARKVYTVVDLQAKLAPAFEFMKRFNS